MTGKIAVAADMLLAAEDILIISHINPDPDTIGSGDALKRMLRNIGKTAYHVCDSVVNERMCGFFEAGPLLDRGETEASGFAPKFVVCVDTAAPQMAGAYADLYSDNPDLNKIDLVLDHHYTNAKYGRYNYIDETRAATGEIIFRLAEPMGVVLTPEIAKSLYCAIITDSGSFRYGSTTPETLRSAAELIATGFDFAKLNRMIYQNKSLDQIAVERMAYNALSFRCGGKIAFIVITDKMKKNNGLEGQEIDGISDIPRIISGVEVGVVARQIAGENGGSLFRVSLRSNDYVNVAEIAMLFGGGGHPRAAGCRIAADASEIENIVERALADAVNAGI